MMTDVSTAQSFENPCSLSSHIFCNASIRLFIFSSGTPRLRKMNRTARSKAPKKSERIAAAKLTCDRKVRYTFDDGSRDAKSCSMYRAIAAKCPRDFWKQDSSSDLSPLSRRRVTPSGSFGRIVRPKHNICVLSIQ